MAGGIQKEIRGKQVGKTLMENGIILIPMVIWHMIQL